MRVCVVGAGYVGLVTGSCIADSGQSVVCVDVDAAKIDRLNQFDIPIFEPGLKDLVQRNVHEGRLRFTTDLSEAVSGSKVVFIAVGTPSRPDGSADLRFVDGVAESIAKFATAPTVVVLKSTVPVGTNRRVRAIVRDASARIEVASNPEFLKEGDAIADFTRPDRVVIGCEPGDDLARDVLSRLYHPFMLRGDQILWTDPASAELTKYVANTMLAMRISFMNEVAMLCEKVGADIHSVRLGVGSDPRIGPKFLYAGPGYGGSCFPKDVKALVHTARDHDLELELASTTDRVNDRHKGVLVRKLRRQLGGSLRGTDIGIWGIAFKPRTDDIRESPALSLVDALLADGANVSIHDPEALENARARYGNRVSYASDMYAAANGADALVLVTEWKQYQNPDFDRLRESMKRPILIDGRNIWEQYQLVGSGFLYEGIGVNVQARSTNPATQSRR